MKYRIEKDTMGVRFQMKNFGVLKQNVLENFKIGKPASMPIEIYMALLI